MVVSLILSPNSVHLAFHMTPTHTLSPVKQINSLTEATKFHIQQFSEFVTFIHFPGNASEEAISGQCGG